MTIVTALTAKTVKNDNTVLYSITDTNDDNAVKTEAAFANTYEKKSSLTVSKAVVNPEYVDESKDEYEFTITFIENGSAAVPENVKIDGEQVAVESGKVTFKLKDGDSAEISDVPVGVKYTLEETTPTDANYEGTAISAKNGDDETTSDSTKIENMLIGEDTNTADVTNTYKEVAPTGIITHYLPYIAVILLAIVAFALFIVSRRRKAARY